MGAELFMDRSMSRWIWVAVGRTVRTVEVLAVVRYDWWLVAYWR